MNAMTSKRQGAKSRRWMIAAAVTAVMTMAACGPLMMMMHGGPERPADQEFGLGPRASAAGSFQATIEPVEQLRTRRLMSVRLRLVDAEGNAIEGATIAVDGGMPQHGHGLPTRPRVTRALGDGTYLVEGVRFNMGGWWELKFRVAGAAGTDSVTFNLDL